MRFQFYFSILFENAIVTPVHKNGAKTSEDNYRLLSILSDISRRYERLMFKQIPEYFEPILSKFQCGFRKGFSAQHCLLAMLEKWKSLLILKEPLVPFSLTCPKLSTAYPMIFY